VTNHAGNTDSVGRGITGRQPVDIDAVKGMSPFDLAQLWSDRRGWNLSRHRAAAEELEELAVMTALAKWLVSWSPITMHNAVLAGAAVEQVAAAARESVPAVAARWLRWADGQRGLHEAGGDFGMPPDEYDRVAALFAAALGLSTGAFTCRPEPS
jgi:hypothetical protein